MNPKKIGIWGHSNGGETALRAMVISPDIKAGVIWAGVVGSFEDISGPIQLHRGTADPQIPVELPLHLKSALEKEGKLVEYYEYQGADHNFSGFTFNLATQRSVNFFKKYL